jgi:hypothetical protein
LELVSATCWLQCPCCALCLGAAWRDQVSGHVASRKFPESGHKGWAQQQQQAVLFWVGGQVTHRFLRTCLLTS